MKPKSPFKKSETNKETKDDPKVKKDDMCSCKYHMPIEPDCIAFPMPFFSWFMAFHAN